MKELGSLSGHLIFIFLAVLFNALYVAAEFALARCRPSKVENLAARGGFLQKLLLRAVLRLNDYISAAQVGITIASLVLGAFAEPFFSKLILPLLQALVIPEIFLHPISFTFSMMLATYIHVVIGEFIPKTLALQYPEEIALATILPLHWSYRITKPLVWVLNNSANAFLRLLGLPTHSKIILAYSEEEIKLLVKESQKEGVIERAEEEMVNKVFEFTDTVVREVMTPRIDIIGIENSLTIAKAAELIIQNRVSKLLVYETNMDNVIGFIHSSDVFMHIYHQRGEVLLKEILRPIKCVPENKPIADLLTEFRKERIQIAIVLDEFGGTAGLVTLEDIIEELVGDIQDEDDLQDDPILQVSDGGYLIESRVSIAEVNEVLGTEFSDQHFDTIGGFVFGLIGRQPQVGDEVIFDGWNFIVEKIERKIEQIKVKRVEQLPPPSDVAIRDNHHAA